MIADSGGIICLLEKILGIKIQFILETRTAVIDYVKAIDIVRP